MICFRRGFVTVGDEVRWVGDVSWRFKAKG